VRLLLLLILELCRELGELVRRDGTAVREGPPIEEEEKVEVG
jgi:hypothetical protein